MSFCAINNETITQANYNQSFDSTRSVLPNSGTGFTGVGADGVVNGAALGAHMATLLSQADARAPGAVSADPNPAKQFSDKATVLRQRVEEEYCFYYKRYNYALTSVLTMAASTSSLGGNSNYLQMKEDVKRINTRLNQILQVMQALVDSRTNSLKAYYGSGATGLNSMNTQLDATRESLIKHSELLQKSEMEMEVKKAMMDYTLEKNSSSRNLLAIYAFMNVVAGGLLFYLYQNSKSA